MMTDKMYLALFDLDGTLFDTSEVNYHAYRDALAPYGAVLDRDYFKRYCNGTHYTSFLPALLGSEEHMEAVHRAKKIAYAENLKRARENTHLFEMIAHMRAAYHTAVVTTASRQNTLDILRYFRRDALFDLLITQEDIVHTKPDPEGFLKAMDFFHMDAARTVIFEDSETGAAAARAAGATVLLIDRF